MLEKKKNTKQSRTMNVEKKITAITLLATTRARNRCATRSQVFIITAARARATGAIRMPMSFGGAKIFVYI